MTYIGYKITEWRKLVFITSTPMLISCLLLFFVEETPLFLLSRRKFKEFKKLIRKLAKINGK